MKSVFMRLSLLILLVAFQSIKTMDNPNFWQRAVSTITSVMTGSMSSEQANQRALAILEGWPHIDRPMPEERKFNTQVLKQLIDAGVNVNIQTKNGQTLLQKAVSQNNLEAVQMLLAAGANANAETIPLRYAVTGSTNPEIVKALLAAGADPNKASDRTVLNDAILGGNITIVQALIDAGADVNAANGGMLVTPLMLAVTYENLPVIQLLLDSGADIGIRNSFGKTALDIARANNKTEIVNLLLRHIKTKI